MCFNCISAETCHAAILISLSFTWQFRSFSTHCSMAIRRAKCLKTLFKEWSCLRAPGTAHSACVCWGAHLPEPLNPSADSAGCAARSRLGCKGSAADKCRETHPLEARGPGEPCTTNKQGLAVTPIS